MTEVNQLSKLRRRNRFQFSVKTLLILFLVASAYLAGWAPATNKLKEAEKRLRELEHERDHANYMVEEIRKSYSDFQKQLASQGVTFSPALRPPVEGIDAGMLIDEFETRSRHDQLRHPN